jgi:hypothetical protein
MTDRIFSLLIALFCLITADAFVQLSSSPRTPLPTKEIVCLQGEGTGGWGIGNSREMVPEEFRGRTERSAFEGYKIEERGEFNRKLRSDVAAMRNEEVNELLNIAKMAGIKVKDPSERLNKFVKDDLVAEEDDEDLDLSI